MEVSLLTGAAGFGSFGVGRAPGSSAVGQERPQGLGQSLQQLLGQDLQHGLHADMFNPLTAYRQPSMRPGLQGVAAPLPQPPCRLQLIFL